MCGIIFGRRTDNKAIFKNIFKRYLKQSHRGDEGFGYITIKEGKVGKVKRFKSQEEVYKSLENEEASEILFHHRFPTSTPNFPDLNHPITVKNKNLEHNYYVVHNGIIRNEETLRTKHEQLGFKYTTVYQKYEVEETDNMSERTLIEEKFNDSESLAIELALLFEGEKNTIDAIGTIAFIVIQTDKKNNVKNIFYGRNTGNPLIVETVDNDMVFIKSEGTGEKIDSDIIYVEDYLTHNITTLDIIVGKQNFPSYNYSGYGYNIHKDMTPRQSILPAKTSFDYDDETKEETDEYIRKHISPSYQRALEGVGSQESEDDELEYASFRLEECESELESLYDDKVKCQTLIDDYNETIRAGKFYDHGLYSIAVVEKIKEVENMKKIDENIEELEMEIMEICESTGLESSLIDFVSDVDSLDEYKNVA